MVDLDALLAAVIEADASDLHLTVGRPPTIRVHHQMRTLAKDALDAEETERLARALCPQRAWEELERVGTTDFAHPFPRGGGAVRGRFRVSVFRHKGTLGAALRLIPSRLRSFEEIGLPDSVKQLLLRPRGLVLVTGPTGSGKTTTLATMIDHINRTSERHIITIEDPIEYVHNHARGIVTQREVGTDVPAFPEAMRRVLRQDPDVILLGEMRDLETIQAAITAAETGHLVFGTLHTTGATRTVDRIVDAFPPSQQDQIRVQLAVSILAVISQVLVPRSDREGLVAAFEILVTNPAIENHIRKNESYKIPSVLQTQRRAGMVLLDDFLLDLYRQGVISRATVLDASQSPRDVEGKLAAAKASAARRT